MLNVDRPTLIILALVLIFGELKVGMSSHVLKKCGDDWSLFLEH